MPTRYLPCRYLLSRPLTPPFAAAGFAILACSISHASLADISDVRMNGFASIAVSTLDEANTSLQGIDNERRFDSDSVLGLQFKLPVNDRVSFTTQFLAKGSEDYDADVEWAFFTLEANEYVDLKGGRLRIPFFMISDNVEVGYSYPWARPPIDVYGQLGFNRFDGGNATYRVAIAEQALSVQAYVGSSSPEQELMGMPVELDISNLWGVNIQLQNDFMQLRIGHTEGDYTINGVEAMFASFSLPPGMSMPEQLQTSDRLGKFTGIGLNFNYENFQWLSEYTRRKTDGIISDTSGWYVTLAYQFGKLQPHITFSGLKTDEDYEQLEGMQSMLAAGDSTAQAMAGMLGNIITMGKVDQDSLTLGLRYDFLPRMTVKAEWQQIEADDNSNGLFDASHTIDDTINVYTIAIDTIF